MSKWIARSHALIKSATGRVDSARVSEPDTAEARYPRLARSDRREVGTWNARPFDRSAASRIS